MPNMPEHDATDAAAGRHDTGHHRDRQGYRDMSHTASGADLPDAQAAGFDADPAAKPRAPFNDPMPVESLEAYERGERSPSELPPLGDAFNPRDPGER
jgi:hypothetical protein